MIEILKITDKITINLTATGGCKKKNKKTTRDKILI